MSYDRIVNSDVLDSAMTVTANAIRLKTGSTDKIEWNETNGFKDAVGEVYEAGKKAENDFFWDSLQDKGKRRRYYNAFSSDYTLKWNDVLYNPKYPIICERSDRNDAYRIFYRSTQITDTKVPIILNGTEFTETFSGSGLRVIRSLTLNNVPSMSYPFRYCAYLEELNVYGEIAVNGFDTSPCKKLNKASHISIMTALSTTTSGLTVTFSKAAVDKAFETSDGANDGSTSPEWLALEATRPNWTKELA